MGNTCVLFRGHEKFVKMFRRKEPREIDASVCVVLKWKIKTEIVRMYIGDNWRNIGFVRSVVNLSSFCKYVVIGF